jgi:4-aminobutyrate aminotransferase
MRHLTDTPIVIEQMAEQKRAQADLALEREEKVVGRVMKIRLYPFVPARAEGVRITDVDGKDYLDFIASAAVIQVGYRHPTVRDAVVNTLDRIWTSMHCCYPTTGAIELAERLAKLLPGDFEKRVWFGTTGSDANDCLSRLLPKATGRRRIITYVGAYHGQTTGSALMSGHQTQADVIGMGNVTKVPYPDPYRCSWGPCSREGCSLKCLDFVERTLQTISPAADTAAIVMEAMQSDAGDIVPPANYIPALRKLCDAHGVWLVFDEVKSGLGRTGKWFAFEHAGVVADAVSLGKPLGGGLPLSAVVGRRELLDQPTYNLFTLGGSPAPCAAGSAVLDVLESEQLLANATARGRELIDGFESLAKRHPLIGDVRGMGLMLGVELVRDRTTREPATREAARLAYRCFELGLIVIYCGIHGNVIELTPPLTITSEDVQEALAKFDRALDDIEAGRFDDAKLAPYAGW